MKLTSLLLLVFCTHLSAATYSQTINLDAENQPLSSVFRTIKKQTNLSVIYNDRLVKPDRKVSIRAQNVPLAEAMKTLLDPLSLTYRITENTIVISARSQSNVRDVSTTKLHTQKQQKVAGRITDVEGNPIQGVTVSVKGTEVGASSDANGNYSITVTGEGGVLVFTTLGYEIQEVEVQGRSVLDIVLEQSTSSLDEVVVVGMNISQTKRSVTGAVSTIQTKELRQSPVANLNNALAGRLPGLISVQNSGQPGADAASLFIRGISTYGSNTAPLVVIDGLPRGTESFSNIDPNEVESISILKDATSSALYGIQGANGVIIVTTKRGSANTKPAIRFTAQSALQQPVRLPQSISSYDLALYSNERSINNGSTPLFDENALQIVRDGTDLYGYPDINWFDEILKNSSSQNQYNLNISGSSNRLRYFVSGSYLNQGTLLKYDDVFEENYGVKSKYDRYNFRSNIDLGVTEMLDVQVDLAARLEQRVGPGPGFGKVFADISGMAPYSMPIFNPDGSLGAASNVEIPYWTNPYGMVTQNGYYSNFTNVMYGTLSATHALDFITQGLSAKAYFSFENNNIKGTSRLQDFDTFWYRGLDINGDPVYQQQMEYSRISTRGTSMIERSNYLDVRLQYDRDFNGHNVNAQVLANRTLRVLDDELPYAYQGVSGRFTYGYLGKYFAEVNLAYNGSENFPPDRRYGFFPSFSAGWVVSDEAFMDVEALSFLKIRGSYGYAGNDKIGSARWLYISDFAPSTGYRLGISSAYKQGFNENRVGNAFVTWEKSRKFNVGFELGVLRNLVHVTFDFFDEYRSNILTAPGSVPDYVGISNLAPRNSGIVSNKGFDTDVRFNKRWNDWSFFANANLTYSKNEVLQNDQPNPAFPYQDLRGYPVGYQLGYKAVGFFNSVEDIQNSATQTFDNRVIPGDIKYMDINSDGVIDAFDRMPIQIHNIPNYMGGLSIGLNYKGFDMSVLMNGALGAKALAIPRVNDPLRLERWSPELLDDAKLPVAKNSTNNDITSDFWITKADYLKLRNAEIGYTLPVNWIKPIGLKDVRLFMNGQNLALWDNLWVKDRDPETRGGSYTYPIQRIFNFGISIEL